MTMDLKSVLMTMKKTYSFVAKIACPNLTNEAFKYLDPILKAKGMTSRTSPKALPLLANTLEFPRLKGYLDTIYKIEMDFEYPIAPHQIVNELCTGLGIDRAFVLVRTEESPFEKNEDDTLDYDEQDYALELLKDAESKINVNPDDYYGDEYNKELVKTLQSKEAKKYQQGFKEVDKKYIQKEEKKA